MALASQKLQEKPITSIHLWLNLQEILQDLHKSCRPHLHNVVHVQLYANEVISYKFYHRCNLQVRSCDICCC